MTKSSFEVKPAAVALMALMAATRFHHFGTTVFLPDASLAIFFLAGLWLGGRNLLAVLLLEAGVIDYLAITQYGVSDFCISPAYLFLIPTYAAMWLAGKWCSQFKQLSLNHAILQLVALVLATSTAFLISNGSFFWLSEHQTDTSWAHYVDGFARYFPSYMGASLLYAVSIVAVVNAVKALLSHNADQHTH